MADAGTPPLVHRDDHASKMGMWLFLFTEILLFGGLFLLYASYRAKYPQAFHAGGQTLDEFIGTVNTVVLITSSLTVALSITALRRGERARCLGLLAFTVACAGAFMHDPDEVELLPGAAEGLRRLRALGLRLVLVTNQSGVGRGYFPSGDVERVHGRLIELLQAQGVRLDAIYTCPHAPGEACGCRKPLPGLIDRASKEIGLDPAQSFVIGDKPCDVDLGLAAGAAASLLVLTGYGEKHAAELRARGDALVVADLAEAAEAIEKLRG